MGARGLALICILFIVHCFGQEHEPAESMGAAEITPSAQPFIQNGCNAFITVEFLYWQAIQQSLIYAETGTSTTLGGAITSSGSVKSPSFPWRPGFKAGVGALLPHDGWDLYANYTYLYSHSTDQTKSSEGNITPIGLNLFGSATTSVAQATFASSEWNLHFNVIDLELGRNFYLSQFLAVRPFGGLKFTWQSQNWNTLYHANQITLGNSTLPGTSKSHQKQNLWGAGLQFGGDGTWFFFRSLSLCSKVAFSALWLDYNNQRKDRYQQIGQLPFIVNDIRKNTDAIKAVLELFLGLRGEWWIKERRYHIAIQGGFDEQVWLNLGEFITSFPNSNGDFSISGATLKARLDF